MTGNAYETLGIAQHATPEEIQSAYRRLAKKLHPDRNPDDAEAVARFRAATEAYTILSDSKKRAAYDRFNRPPSTISELYTRPSGRRLMSVLLPSAPKAEQQGTHEVLLAVLENGRLRVGDREFSVPANNHAPRWLRIFRAGGEGRNGGEPGDLFVTIKRNAE